jgi:hypothetical protein
VNSLFKLQKLNVIKVVEAENEKDKLIANGFEIIEDKADPKGKK